MALSCAYWLAPWFFRFHLINWPAACFLYRLPQIDLPPRFRLRNLVLLLSTKWSILCPNTHARAHRHTSIINRSRFFHPHTITFPLSSLLPPPSPSPSSPSLRVASGWVPPPLYIRHNDGLPPSFRHSCSLERQRLGGI